MQNISDTEIETAVARTPSHILDISYAYETAVFLDSLTTNYKIPKRGKSIVAEEIFFLLLRITRVSEAIERLVERTAMTPDTASKLIQEFGNTYKGTIPTETTPQVAVAPAPKPIDVPRQTTPESTIGLRELSDFEPKITPKPPVVAVAGEWATRKEEPAPLVTLGNVPDASNELRERLELRPKSVLKRAFAEEPEEIKDDEGSGLQPLTRTQILQSLTSKRTMASDIASIHKTSDTNT